MLPITTGPTLPATLADRVYRLACQTEAWDNLSVLVTPIFEEAAFQILAETQAFRLAAGFTPAASHVEMS